MTDQIDTAIKAVMNFGNPWLMLIWLGVLTILSSAMIMNIGAMMIMIYRQIRLWKELATLNAHHDRTNEMMKTHLANVEKIMSEQIEQQETKH